MRARTAASTLAVWTAIGMLAACGSPRRQPVTPRPAESQPPGSRHAGESRRVAVARSLIGSRYRFGGETPSGFDCSGFVRYVFERDGVSMPRLASDQARVGHWVPLDEVAAGDLVFFSEVGGKPHHVGLVVSPAGQGLRMIHASTSAGVVETDVFRSAYWMRRLRFGRRVEPGDGGGH